MDIHTSTTSDISDSPQKTSWRQGQVFQSLEALRPWMQWGLLILMAIGGMYLYQRDTNAQQNLNLTELQRKQDILQKTMDERWQNRNKEIGEMKNSIVSKELFEERTNYINKRLELLDERTMEILNRLPVRSP